MVLRAVESKFERTDGQRLDGNNFFLKEGQKAVLLWRCCGAPQMRGSQDFFSTSPGISAGSNAFGSEFSVVNCSSPRAATFPEPSGITSFEGWISDPTRSRRAFQSTSSKLLTRAKPQEISLTSVAAADSSGHGIAHGSLADSQAAATRSQLSPSPTANTSHPPSSPPASTFRLRVPSGFICPLTGRIMRDPVIPVPVLLPLPQLLPHAGPLKAAAPSPLVATVQPPAQQMKVVAQHGSPAATALAPEALAARYRLPQCTSGWYERAAILSWLAAQSEAHTLLQPQLQLVANVSLRVAIQEWLQQHSLDYAAADQLLLLLQLERGEQRGQEREGEGEQEDTAAQCGTHSGKKRGLGPDGEAGPGPGIGPGIALGAVQIPVHAAAVATAPAPVRVPVLAGERIRHTACGFGIATTAVATGAAAAPSDAAAAPTSVVQQVQVQVLAPHVQGGAASAVAPLTAAVSAAPSIAPAITPVGVGVGAAWTWSSSRGYECLRSSVSSSWGSRALGGGSGGSWPWRTAVRPPPAPTATAPGPSPALAGRGHGPESWGGSVIAGGATESSTPAPLASGIASPAAAGWTLAMGEVRRGSPEGASITARPPLRYPGLMLHRTYSAVTTMGEISAFGSTERAAAAISSTGTSGPKQTSTSFANAVEAVTAAAAGFTQTPGDQALSYTGFEAAAATAGLRPAQPISRVLERSEDGIGGVGCRSWPWLGVSLYQQHALPRQGSGHTAAAATAALPAAVNGGGGSSSLCVERLQTGPPVTDEAAGRLYHRSLSAPAASPQLPAPRQGLPLPSVDTQQLLRPLQQQQEQQLRHPSQQPFHHRRQQPQVPQPLHRLSREWSAGSGASVAVTTRDRQRRGAIRIQPDWPAAEVDQLMSAGQGAVDRRRAPEPRCTQPPPSLPQPQQQYAKQQHLTQPGLIGRGYAEPLPLPLLLPQQQELWQAMGLQPLSGQAAEQDPQYFADSRGGCTSVPGDLSSPSVMNAAQWDVGGYKGPIWRRLWSGGSGAMRTLLNRLQGQMAGLWSRGKDGILKGWGSDPWGGDETNDYCGADTAAAAAVPVQSASDSEAMVSARDGCSDSESGGISGSCQSGKGSTDGDSIACGDDGAGGRGWMGSKWEVGRTAESLSPATRQGPSSASLNQAKVGNRPRAGGALSGCRAASGGVDETTTGGAHAASIGGRWWRRMAAYRSHPSFLRAEDVGTAPARNLVPDLQNPVRGKDREVGWQKPGYRRADDGGSGGDDASWQRPPPGPLELPLELPLPLQWLTADQLADCGLSARDEAQAAERQRQRVWRWLRGVPPPACRDLLTLLRCTTLAPETRPTATAAPLTSSSMATRRGRGLAAAPLRCISVGSHLPHRITALAVLPPPPGPPALAYSLPQFPADPPSSGDGAPISAPTGEGNAAVADGIPPAPSPPTRGSFAILVTRDHPGHVLVEELPSAAAAATVRSPSVVSEQDQSQPTDAGTGRGGRCWMVPAVRGRVTVVAACPRGGSLAVGTSAGLVFVWRCFPAESLRALQDLREMEAREQPSAAAVGAAAAGMGPAVQGRPWRPGSGYGYPQRRGSSEAAAPMLEWQLCGRLGWSEEAEIGGGGGGGGGGGNDADCGVTAVAYDGTGATLFAACRGVVAGWKLRHFEQPERIPSVVTAAFLILTPDDYGVMANHCNTRSDGAASSSSWFGRRGSCGGGGGAGRRSEDDTLGSAHSAMPFTTNHNHTPDVILCNSSGVRFSSSGGGSGDLPPALDLGPSPWGSHALEEEEEAAVSVAASAPLCDGAVTARLPITSSGSLSLPLPSSAATASAAVFTAAAPAMASYGPPSNLTSSPLRNTASALSFRFSSAPSDLPSLPSSAPLPCWAGKHSLLNTASARNYPTVCCLAASPSGAHLALALSDGAVHLALHADCPCRTVCVRLLPPSPQSVLAGAGQPFPGWATQVAFSGDERRLLVLALGFGPTRSRTGGGGAAAAPSREHLQQRRAGASDNDFIWRTGGGVPYNGGGAGRIISAKPSVGGKEEEGEEGAMAAAEARYSLHCFPLTQDASEVEEEEKETAEEGVAAREEGGFSDSTGRSDAGMVAVAGLPHRRGDSGAIGNRTAVHGTCVYAALDSDDDDDDDDDPWVREVCVLGKDGDEDDDNLVEPFSGNDNAHVEGKDDNIYDDVGEGYRLGSEGVHEERKKGKVRKLHATLLHKDAGGAPSGKAGVPWACAGAAKDAVADLKQQHPLVLSVGARDQGLEASRNIAGGIHNRQLRCSEAPSDVAASCVFASGDGSSTGCPRSRLQLQRRCRHGCCSISRTAGLAGGKGAGDGGNGGRGGGGGGGCYSEVVLCGLRVPPQSAHWRPRLANLVVATDGTSALLLDRCPSDLHPWEPGNSCNQNCQQSKQSPQQMLLQLQEGQQDHQLFPARKHQQRKERQQLVFVDMATGRARRLPLELHPCDRNYYSPYRRQDHHHRHPYQQHQQPPVSRCSSGGGAASNPNAVVDSSSAAATTATSTVATAVMPQKKQRLYYSCCGCSCMALLPGGRELLVGGDLGLLRWTFGADGGDVSREHLWDMGL